MVAKVNTDENQEYAGRYGVQGIPTMLFIADGKVLHRQVGAVPENVLRDTIDQFLSVVARRTIIEKSLNLSTHHYVLFICSLDFCPKCGNFSSILS